MNSIVVSCFSLAALTVVLVEVAMRLPFRASLQNLIQPSFRSISVMRAEAISDHWKERAMLLYARRTLRGVGQFSMNLGLIALIALLVGAALEWAVVGFVAFSLGTSGLLLTLAFAIVWGGLRSRFAGESAKIDSDYSFPEQMIHKMALGNEAIAELTFAVDQKFWPGQLEAAKFGEHVFVAGLARAGTTALTRALQDTGEFASLTYRDMPFVLAPNFWRRMPGRRSQSIEARERAHGDGVIVDIDSPESLEEPFWRVFDRNAYLKADRLLPHNPSFALAAKYQCYVASILRARGVGRYLAKNNNNILRLGMLAETFPNAHVLVPFRHPLSHAKSLLTQHRRFCEMHRQDPFSRDYMGWLAHHEFGSDHRFFDLGKQPTGDPRELGYWVAQWCNMYAWLLEAAPPGVAFVCYEDLCNDPQTWPRLAGAIGVKSGAVSPFRVSPKPDCDAEFPMRDRAKKIYNELVSRSRI